jgi:hypothetical protein
VRKKGLKSNCAIVEDNGFLEKFHWSDKLQAVLGGNSFNLMKWKYHFNFRLSVEKNSNGRNHRTDRRIEIFSPLSTRSFLSKTIVAPVISLYSGKSTRRPRHSFYQRVLAICVQRFFKRLPYVAGRDAS